MLIAITTTGERELPGALPSQHLSININFKVVISPKSSGYSNINLISYKSLLCRVFMLLKTMVVILRVTPVTPPSITVSRGNQFELEV